MSYEVNPLVEGKGRMDERLVAGTLVPLLVECLKCQRGISVRASITIWGERRWTAVCMCGAIYISRDNIHWIPK